MQKIITYEKNTLFEFNEVDEKLVIFEPTGNEIYVLEKLEKEIFQLFDDGSDIFCVINTLNEKYKVHNLKEDIEEFVYALLKKGILVEKV